MPPRWILLTLLVLNLGCATPRDAIVPQPVFAAPPCCEPAPVGKRYTACHSQSTPTQFTQPGQKMTGVTKDTCLSWNDYQGYEILDSDGMKRRALRDDCYPVVGTPDHFCCPQ